MRDAVGATARALDRWNARHPWSHNDALHPFVLRQARRLPRRGRALDVGCGTGGLLRALSPLFDEVVGVEVDPGSAGAARRGAAALTNVCIEEADLTVWRGGRFDLVTAIAVLHHLPLDEGLEALRRATAPGGRLVVVGVHRDERGYRLRSIVSALLNPVVGLVRHPRPAAGLLPQVSAPVAHVTLPFTVVRRALEAHLPGVRVRSRLFWRWTATWSAPEAEALGAD